MTGALFQDSLEARTRPAYNMVENGSGKKVPNGPPIGVNVVLPCHECGRELTLQFPWNEVAHLLNGGQVQGMWPDGNGWRGEVYCPGYGGMACQSRGGRTVVRYRIFVKDLRDHFDNFRAMQSRGAQQPPGAGGYYR